MDKLQIHKYNCWVKICTNNIVLNIYKELLHMCKQLLKYVQSIISVYGFNLPFCKGTCT